MGDLIVPSRRRFLIGAALSLVAAPAIVKASNLMAIKPFDVLAATGMEIPIDLELADYLAQYKRFQKGFLIEYRKEVDPARAKAFDVVGAACKVLPGIPRYERNGPLLTTHYMPTVFDV